MSSRGSLRYGTPGEWPCRNEGCDGVVEAYWRRTDSQCPSCAARQAADTRRSNRQYNVQYAEWKQTEAYQRYLAAKEVVRAIRRPLIAQLNHHHPEQRDALDKLHPLPRPTEFGAPERPAR